jgi:hypothetical protein
MPGEDDGEAIPLLLHQFHQALQFRQRFARQRMSFINEEGNRLAALADQI